MDVPLPPTMIDAEVEHRLAQVERQAEQYGIEADQLLEAQDTTREDFEQRARSQAEQSVKAQLVLDALARRIEVSIEPADIDQEIVRHAQANGVAPEDVARLIQEQGSLPALVGDIMRRKTIDAIVEAADVDGGPSEEILVEVGLAEDPDAGDGAEDVPDAAQDAPSGLIVPGQDPAAGGGGRLVVPGQD